MSPMADFDADAVREQMARAEWEFLNPHTPWEEVDRVEASDFLETVEPSLPIAVRAVTDAVRELMPGDFIRTQHGCVSRCEWMIKSSDLGDYLNAIDKAAGVDRG